MISSSRFSLIAKGDEHFSLACHQVLYHVDQTCDKKSGSREGYWLVRELASPRTGTDGRRGAACCCLFPLLVPMIGSDEALIPEGAVFENAALRGVIDIDDTETLAIAFSPLKVVEQRPDEVAT